MSIIVKGDNKGLILDGSVDIDNIEFEPGVGIKNVSGVRRHGCADFVDAEEVLEAEYTEVAEVSAKEEQTNDYPEITDESRRFFKSKIWVVDDKPRRAVDFPVEEMLHTIYYLTLDWNPEERTSVHKWKILYEVLLRLHYFDEGERKRYAQFVTSVIKYCFCNVKNTYKNNLSSNKLDSSIASWSEEDTRLYLELKDSLELGNLTSSKSF